MKVLSGDYSKIQRSNYFYLNSDTKSIVDYKQLMQIAAGGTAGYPIYLSSVYFLWSFDFSITQSELLHHHPAASQALL